MLVPLVASGSALIFAVLLIFHVLKQKAGTGRMKEVSSAIGEGARAYMKRQYGTIALFIVGLSLLITFLINWQSGLSFVVGSVFSAIAGYVGMNTSIRTNVRVAQAARKGLQPALQLAVRGGVVTGMFVVGLALLGVSIFYLLYQNPLLLVGFGFGACLVSLFARIGGGIYTKAADVGADLVGKVEKGIPEDDPRNPAVIADQVGDNVGDCAGMAADLFETYAVTAIGAMLLGALLFADVAYVVYPLFLGAVGIFACIVGSFFMRGGKSIMRALYKGLLVTGIVAVAGFYLVSVGLSINLFWAALVGLLVVIGLFALTEYYTSEKFSWVRGIAQASQAGPAINLSTGIAVGMHSVALPALVICAGILAAYWLNGVYGIAVAVMAMLSLTGLIIGLDSYGPITDNASGIAEMSGLPKKVRKVTDALDAVGNTTKAVTKVFAIGSAALAALTLFIAYQQEVGISLEAFTLSNPLVLVGLLVGGLIPFLFSSLCIRAVGKAAFQVVEEVRKQFREIPGLLQGKSKPNYARCVDIVTQAALRKMMLPTCLAVCSPLAVGLLLGPLALGGLLLGSIITGLFLALQMATGGAAWDNAKKYIEEGALGGKGSQAHRAAVIGDTVGDPQKDTAAPAINPLIKVMNTVAILFAPLIIAYALL